MKWFNNIFLILLLLFITGSTNSSDLENTQQLDSESTLILPIAKESLETLNVNREIKEVKVLMNSTKKELKELKLLIEQKRIRDSLIIHYYTNY